MNTEPIYCLSLWQPYASLLAYGLKRYETRSWRAAAYYEGKLFVIHAAKKWDDTTLHYAYDPIFDAALTEAGQHPGKLPLGCALETARLVRCIPTDGLADVLSERERAFGDYHSGRWAWQFAEARPFAKPMPMRGQQGIWQWEGTLPTYADEVPAENLPAPNRASKMRRID